MRSFSSYGTEREKPMDPNEIDPIDTNKVRTNERWFQFKNRNFGALNLGYIERLRHITNMALMLLLLRLLRQTALITDFIFSNFGPNKFLIRINIQFSRIKKMSQSLIRVSLEEKISNLDCIERLRHISNKALMLLLLRILRQAAIGMSNEYDLEAQSLGLENVYY